MSRPTAVGLAEPPNGRDVELGRLRELLWMRLAVGAYLEQSLNDHLIGQFREVGRKFANEGRRAERNKVYREWGRWLRTVGGRFNQFADEVDEAREIPIRRGDR